MLSVSIKQVRVLLNYYIKFYITLSVLQQPLNYLKSEIATLVTMLSNNGGIVLASRVSGHLLDTQT